jgi:hypothetical protein
MGRNIRLHSADERLPIRTLQRDVFVPIGLGSAMCNLCLTNSVHEYRRYIIEERDRMQGAQALIGSYCSPKFNDDGIC